MTKATFDTMRISLYPKAIVVVTSINNAGMVGATPIAWNGILSSRPPVIGVSFLPDSFTRQCILESREFVVNVPYGVRWKEVNYLGSVSGSWTSKMERFPAGFQKLNLTPSAKIRTPRIDEFYLSFECRNLQTVQIGLYDCFFGEVLAMHCDQAIFQKNHPKGNINHKVAQPLLCLGDQYWCNGTFLGSSSENKDHPHGREH